MDALTALSLEQDFGILPEGTVDEILAEERVTRETEYLAAISLAERVVEELKRQLAELREEGTSDVVS
jgi:hypothetical protein